MLQRSLAASGNRACVSPAAAHCLPQLIRHGGNHLAQPILSPWVCRAAASDASSSSEAPNNKPSMPGWQKYAAAGVFALALGGLVLGGTTAASAATAAGINACSSISDVMCERLLYLLGKVSSIHIALKVVLVLSSTLPAVLLFGWLYSRLTSTDFKASCVKFYALLNRLPGAEVLTEATVPAALLVNLAFFFGLFTFAVVLGVVTDEVKTTFQTIKSGQFAVRQTGHLVVCGWNLPLLRQLAAAKHLGQDQLFRRPIAVLADMPKSDMDQAVAKLEGGLEVYTRTGNPNVPGDLAKVAAEKAASIIWLRPSREASSGSTAGTGLIQAAVALATSCPNLPLQNVVLQAPQEKGSSDHLAVFHSLTPQGRHIQMLKYSDKQLVERMMTLSAIQPGIVRVVQQLLGPTGASIHFQTLPIALQGSTYRQARRAFADGIVCGYIRGEDGPVHLEPGEEDIMRWDDHLVILSVESFVPTSTKSPQVYASAGLEVDARLKTNTIKYHQQPCHIIVICLDPSTLASLDLGSLTPRGSSVTFVVPSVPPGAPARIDNCTFKYVVPSTPGGSCCTQALLQEAGIKGADSVLLTGMGQLPPAEADAFVTAALLQVQDASRASGRAVLPHFVAQVQSSSTMTSLQRFLDLMKDNETGASASPPAVPRTRLTAPRIGLGGFLRNSKRAVNDGNLPACIGPDLFRADDLVTGVLAQSASHFRFADVACELLTSEGAEFYFRNPAAFNLPVGDLFTFADVEETTRVFGETCVGVVRADGSTILAPEPSFPINFQIGDKIVVLAGDFDVTKLKKQT